MSINLSFRHILYIRHLNTENRTGLTALGSFREMPLSPHQYPNCAPSSQETAGGSRCCPLISHSPLWFKSIVNYLQNAHFLSSKWSGQRRAGRNSPGRGIQRRTGWWLSSHHGYILAHQPAPLRSCPSILLRRHFHHTLFIQHRHT